MKASWIITAFIALFYGFIGYLIYSLQGPPLAPSHAVRIVRQNTDERGLTCVEFVQDGKVWALDFLTKPELDSLTSIK